MAWLNLKHAKAFFFTLGIICLLIFLMYYAAFSSLKKNRAAKEAEIVLTPGMKLVAITKNGKISIVADDLLARVVSESKWSFRPNIQVRTQRWNGSLGLYSSAESLSPHGRLIYEEGRLFFSSESEALRYLYVGSALRRPVYNNRGLVVSYYKTNDPNDRHSSATRSVQVWQIYINGKRPTKMEGADDSAIMLSVDNIPDQASPTPSQIGQDVRLGNHEYHSDLN